jgi:hypothetical protein
MSTVHGSYDSAGKSCVLLYDFSAGSFEGEPTKNLFTQPENNNGFEIKPSTSSRIFYKIPYSGFESNASGDYLDTDSMYKYNFSSSEYDTNATQTGGGNKHGFLINIIRGETYTASLDVFISTDHPRTGEQPVFSLNPNLSGTFSTITSNYDCDRKGTWQTIEEKVFVPPAINAVSTDPIYYELSVANKTSAHPYYGQGSSFGFSVGNVEGKTLYLYKGGTYIFMQTNSSNSQDELYISTSIDSGGGDNSFLTGFTYFGNKGLDGYAVFNVPYNAPNVLFYNSRRNGSSYVGGKINIVGGYNSGNVGNTGNTGCVGNTGNTGTTLTSESYAVCFDPTRGIVTQSDGDLSAGYILYKNMQFEQNKKMFKGLIHKTQFTSTSRSSSTSITDLTGNNKNSSQFNANYDSGAHLLFDRRNVLNDGGFIDLNLKSNQSQTFTMGSNTTQSFDFWFKQTSNSNARAYLFSRASSTSNNLFVNNEGNPHCIYIQNKRVYFSFSTADNRVFSAYTINQLIDVEKVYNIIVSINLNSAVGNKAKIYINGSESSIEVFDVLNYPDNFSFSNVVASVKNIGNTASITQSGFRNNSSQFYRISSYDDNGESLASPAIAVPIDSVKKSVRLSWDPVTRAAGYYIYRSNSSNFSSLSLLANITGADQNYFTDENFPLKNGSPQNIANYINPYNQNSTNFVDDSNAKLVIGDYPTTDFNANYFQGYIFRAAFYNTNITSYQAKRNYNSFYDKYKSGQPYLSNEFPRSKSVIHRKVQY